MLNFSQFWIIHELTQSPLYLGYVGLANALPAIALNIFGGVVADRLDRKRLKSITQTIIGVIICREDQDLILSTKLGKCIRFMSKKLRIFKGRSSKGIKGIELATGDQVIDLSLVNNVNINPKMVKKLLQNVS